MVRVNFVIQELTNSTMIKFIPKGMLTLYPAIHNNCRLFSLLLIDFENINDKHYPSRELLWEQSDQGS